MARERVEFWLDKNKPREKRLLDKIAELKARNKFASTVRKGILLVPELEAGNYEMLAQMYPDVVNKLLAAMVEQGVVIVNPPPDTTPPPETPPIDYDKLAKEVATQIVLQGGVNPVEMQSAQPTPGPKPLAAPSFAMPTFEDDDIPALVTTASSQDSSMNFVSALRNMQ